MNVWLKLTMDDFVYVFDAWRKWSCGVVCVWPRTNSNTIVATFIWFCYLEWMIYGGKSIWCDLLKSKIYQVEGTVLVSVRIFVNKINTYYEGSRRQEKAWHKFSRLGYWVELNFEAPSESDPKKKFCLLVQDTPYFIAWSNYLYIVSNTSRPTHIINKV